MTIPRIGHTMSFPVDSLRPSGSSDKPDEAKFQRQGVFYYIRNVYPSPTSSRGKAATVSARITSIIQKPERPPILLLEKSTEKPPTLFEGKVVTVTRLYQSSFQKTSQYQPSYLTGHVDGATVHVNCMGFSIQNLIGKSVLARITRVFSSQHGGTRYEATALKRSIPKKTPY